ncbi:MAG: LrgB family protein [Actinomycetota bacterium]|nr:LrgB family protein [Actinomycetota bacterium]
MHLHETGRWMVTSPLTGLLLTLLAYAVGRWVYQRTGGHPVAQPVLVAIVLVSTVLLTLRVSYADYLHGASYVGFWLGPATVALALPLHHELDRVRRSALPVLIGVLAGAFTSVTSALLVTRWFGGDRLLQLTMAPKAATTPVSVAISERIGGLASLTAVLTILAGITGAVAGPWLLTRVGVRDPRARGIALGAASHGIGTARALHESATEGAFSALSMALTALATSLVVPLLLLFL